MKLLLQCKHCGNKMQYEPVGTAAGKSKTCVYCGRSFKVKDAVRKQVA